MQSTLYRWAGLAALAFAALLLRSVPLLDVVLTVDGVNYQETDAWHHLRLIEAQHENWPRPLKVDPLSLYPAGQPSSVAPLFDFVIATAGLVLPLDLAAAWAPPVLAAVTVIAVWGYTQAAFGSLAGWLAALLAAGSAGRWLSMGKLGFTDHHVLEGLTAAFLLWALVRWRPWWAGAALGAYLLTWVGGALVAALVVAWMAFELILDRRRFRASMTTLALALACVVPFFDSLWMEYSMAVLAGGMVVLSCIQLAGWRWTLGVVAAGAGIAVWLKPELAGILNFITSPSNATGVAELRPLVYRSGQWTLVPYFQQLGVVGLVMIPALGLLARRLVGSTGSGFRLLWAWAIVFLVLAAGQERLTQYSLLGAIPLGAGLVAWLVDRLRPALRPFAVTAAALLLVGPSVVFYPQILGPDSGVPPAWREALAWVRTQTPDPATQPYGILNWWGSGYWITALAHRQPLSNPTQTGAEEAARLLLSEDPAIAATMAKQGLWYAVVSSELLLLPSAQGATGAFTSVVGGAGQNISNYLQTFYRAVPDGSLRPEVRFMPAYFRTLIARLGLSGPWRHAGSASVQALAYVRKQRQGQSYKEIVAEFAGTPEQADLFIAQQQALGNDASRVSDNPAVPCIPVELPAGIRQVFPEASRMAPETLVFAIAR